MNCIRPRFRLGNATARAVAGHLDRSRRAAPRAGRLELRPAAGSAPGSRSRRPSAPSSPGGPGSPPGGCGPGSLGCGNASTRPAVPTWGWQCSGTPGSPGTATRPTRRATPSSSTSGRPRSRSTPSGTSPTAGRSIRCPSTFAPATSSRSTASTSTASSTPIRRAGRSCSGGSSATRRLPSSRSRSPDRRRARRARVVRFRPSLVRAAARQGRGPFRVRADGSPPVSTVDALNMIQVAVRPDAILASHPSQHRCSGSVENFAASSSKRVTS